MGNKFVGMSTVANQSPPFTLTDVDIIKQDLMNAFYTKKGERVMMPDYGSVIWDYLMDPLDINTKAIIQDDVERIVGMDPRVILVDTTVIQSEHGLVVQVELNIDGQVTPSTIGLTLEYRSDDI